MFKNKIEELVQKLYNPDNNIACGCMKKLQEIANDNNEIYYYFDEFVKMLDDKNSYIRTRGIWLISSCAKWDCNNKINLIIEKFLVHIEDEKPITSRQCIQSLENIIKYKKELIPTIQEHLLKINYLKYNDSMQSLVFKDSEKILELIKQY